MKTPLKLDELRPLLKDCTLYQGEMSIVIEHGSHKAQIVLPKEHGPILELLDGTNSIKDISAKLYHTQGQVSFHSILTTIKLLSEADLLEEMDHDFQNIKKEMSPHENRPSLLNRPIFEMKLLSKMSSKWAHDGFLYVLVALLMGIVYVSFKSYSALDLSRFLKSPLGYNEALVRLVIISSVLMCMKAVTQGILLLGFTGTLYGVDLKIYPYALGLGINDNSLYGHARKSSIILYGIVSASLYLICFGALTLLSDLRPYRHDIGILAIILTFIELNPYRRSDLTKLFHFFYADNQLKSILPYLKNCTFTGLWKDTGARMGDEIRYVIYSVLAISWAVGFSLFSFEIMMRSIPGLFHQIQLGSPVSRYSAALVMGLLGFITLHLSMDLFHTLIKNILSPLTLPLMKMFGAKKVSAHKEVGPEEVKKHLKNHMLFNQLSDESLDYILEHSGIFSLKAGAHLVFQGDEGRSVYFLLEGSADVSVREQTGREKHIVKLKPHTVVGEMGIFEKCSRTASVKASEELTYLEIPEEVFSHMREHGEFHKDIDKLRKRIELSQFVSTANLFKDFPPEIMNLFVEAGDLVLFPAGHNIVDEGETDKTFYLLIKGRVDIIKGVEKVAELSQGDFFGEVALIANVPRTASVRTQEDSLFLYIEDKRFWNILSSNIELAMYIESVGRNRLAEAA